VLTTATPTSETRALVKVQDELYAMLGMSPLESGTVLRRARSVLTDTELSPAPSPLRQSNNAEGSSDDRRRHRPSSLPRNYGGLHTEDVSQFSTLFFFALLLIRKTMKRQAMLAMLAMDV
jgi:hypothetical protein